MGVDDVGGLRNFVQAKPFFAAVPTFLESVGIPSTGR